MDMDGRSLGTERSSTFQDGISKSQPTARISAALAGGDRFAAMLAGRTEEGSGPEPKVDLSARVREGRTDAATATYNAREARNKAWKPRNERTVERRDSSESWEVADAEPEAGGQESSAGAAASEATAVAVVSQGRAQSHSHGGPSQGTTVEVNAQTDPDTSDVQGLGGSIAVQPAAAGPIGSNLTQGPALTQAASSVQAAASVAPVSALGGAASSRGPAAQPAQAVQANASTSAAKGASKAAAPRPSLPPEDARAILNEVRIQILDGKREARIQLRPIELGRLDLLIRVDGQHVVAKVAAMSLDALAVLESHAPELRAWLSKDGAESVDLEFSLIETGTDEFAHQGGEQPEASFESAAERHALASPGRIRRSEAKENAPSLGAGAAGRRSSSTSLQAGVDFVA